MSKINRLCAGPDCKNTLGPEQPKRKLFCSGACRLASHRQQVGRREQLETVQIPVRTHVILVDDTELSKILRERVRKLSVTV